MAAFVWLLVAAEARAVTIDVGSAVGMPGADVLVDVSLHTMGASALGTQNRIDFDRATPIAAASGAPDCSVNAAIHKQATSFRFLPLGCDPALDCQSVRAFVFALDNLTPIPDGSVLYTCRIAIAADAAAGIHPLHNAEALASAPDGEPLPTTGSDGAVDVVLEPAASIDLGSAAGTAGSTVEFAVTLRLLTAPPADVAGVMNDIGFDPLTPIAVAADGTPACHVGIDSVEGRFAFRPPGCTPAVDCDAVRALLLPVADSPPIADGATLYTCAVAIAADAPPGTYPLSAALPTASGPHGDLVLALASDGAIEVTAPPPPACVGDCDGDGVVAINELLIGVNIVTGAAPLSACRVLDQNGDGTVSVNELVRAVNNALNRCPRA